MIVLDDPANPFSLIFSIRKIPNDLLDLERLNRPGESVPSRESRTSTLKGLFLLEGPAAALCIRTADFRFLCRFSDAGMTRLSTRCGGRRPKSAKARSRGKWGTGGAAGAVQPRGRGFRGGEFFEGGICPQGMHNFWVIGQILLNGGSKVFFP